LKIIHFAPLVEGFLDEYFIKQVLKGVAFSFDSDFTFNRYEKLLKFKGGSKNKAKVLSNLGNLSQQIALESRRSEIPILFIAGIDSDKEDFNILVSQLESQIDNLAKEITLIFVAVQDVETWAEYLLKPDSKPGELDNGSSKMRIYPDGKSNEENAKTIIKEIREKNGFQMNSLLNLASQSPSYQHFHQQILSYLQKIS